MVKDIESNEPNNDDFAKLSKLARSTKRVSITKQPFRSKVLAFDHISSAMKCDDD